MAAGVTIIPIARMQPTACSVVTRTRIRTTATRPTKTRNKRKDKINKNITEITSDRYKRGAKENAMKCKGYQNMDPAHNPSIQHHAKNADQLNPYLYKEDYEGN